MGTVSCQGSRPNTVIVPESVRSRPSNERIVVDLPAPVGAEEAVHLPRRDGEVEAIEGPRAAEGLDEVLDDEDGIWHPSTIHIFQFLLNVVMLTTCRPRPQPSPLVSWSGWVAP